MPNHLIYSNEIDSSIEDTRLWYTNNREQRGYGTLRTESYGSPLCLLHYHTIWTKMATTELRFESESFEAFDEGDLKNSSVGDTGIRALYLIEKSPGKRSNPWQRRSH
jgi:hypothetical protein